VESWPEFVIVPARRSPDRAEVELETRHSLTGLELVLPAFSSVKNLVRLLGYGQPWVRTRLRDARAAAAAAGLGRIVIDPEEMAWQPASR
jgi:hypothetical protein